MQIFERILLYTVAVSSAAMLFWNEPQNETAQSSERTVHQTTAKPPSMPHEAASNPTRTFDDSVQQTGSLPKTHIQVRKVPWR